MMTQARWPNAKFTNKTLFDSKYWGRCADTGNDQGKNNNWTGTIKDLNDDQKYPALSSLNKNITGALVILNICSWNTLSAIITNTTANDSFQYKAYWKSSCLV